MKNRSYRHWMTVVMMCCLASGSIGICTNATGVFFTPVSESLGVMRGSFALHATLQSLAMAMVTLQMGKMIDRYSYRKLLMSGVVLSVLATLGMSFAGSLWQFYILGILRGIGIGVYALVPVTMILSFWFEKKHGLATGIALSFSGLAGAVFSPLFNSLIGNYGWRNAYVIQAVLLLAVTLLPLVYRWTVRPEDCGLLPYGSEETEKKEKISVSTSFNYMTVGFICMCVFCLLHTSITGIAQHLTGFTSSIGMSAAFGASLMSLAMIGNISMKLLIGVISDAAGPIKANIVMMSGNMISLILFLSGMKTGSTVILSIAAFLYGTVYATGAAGIPLLTRYFFGSENYSMAYSKIGFLTNVGSSLSLTLIGFLYDFTGSYAYMFVIALVFHVIDLCMVAMAYRNAGK